jgi:hypothetical protein
VSGDGFCYCAEVLGCGRRFVLCCRQSDLWMSLSSVGGSVFMFDNWVTSRCDELVRQQSRGNRRKRVQHEA